MKRDVRIIHARDFLRVRPDSTIDVEESKRLLLQVSGVLKGAQPEVRDILLDTRNAISTLSSGDLWYLADFLASHDAVARCRTAILCPKERFDYASFYALCAARHGVNMQPFTSYEEAIQWLLEIPAPT